MKKAVVKILRQIAAELPEQHKTIQVKMTGAAILAAKPDGKYTSGGNPILKNKYYSQPVKKQVNHLEICKNLFKSQGIEAVRDYANKLLGPRPVVAKKIEELKEQQKQLTQKLEDLKNG